MTAVLYRKRGLTLVPADDEARQDFAKIRDGQPVHVEIKRHRNMALHRRYFAQLRALQQASGEWASVDALWFQIAKELGRGHPMVDRQGNVHWIPQSRSCAAMAGDDFEALFRETDALLIAWGYDPNDIREAA